jgi:hypothetical protein
VHLTPVDYAILVIYFLFVLGIGWRLRKSVTSAGEFLSAGHHVPVWITSLAFLAANLGAQEVVGMCASGAKYGIMTSHFYWIGAVPAMLFVGVFMMPFYYGSKARSVPEYLKLRFDEKTRGLNAITFAIMTLFSSGISMYALAKMFNLVLGWNFNNSIILSGAIVLAYTYLGGLTSAIYNEVLQFFLIVLGFSPLAILAVSRAGGWGGIQQRLPDVMTHAWKYIGTADQNPMGVEAFGLVAGLGFVLSFGYWCTDFLVIQRAMAANSMSAARAAEHFRQPLGLNRVFHHLLKDTGPRSMGHPPPVPGIPSTRMTLVLVSKPVYTIGSLGPGGHRLAPCLRPEKGAEVRHAARNTGSCVGFADSRIDPARLGRPHQTRLLQPAPWVRSTLPRTSFLTPTMARGPSGESSLPAANS